MPSVIKRKTSHVAESGFSIYDGDEPTPGAYRAVIKQLNMQKSAGDNLMVTGVLELKAKDGSAKKQYDGYPVFPMIPLTDAESNVQREQALYLAIAGKKDADLVTEGDPAKFKKGDKQKTKILKVGGVNPIGMEVNVRLRLEADNREGANGAMQLKADQIFKVRDSEQSHEVPEEDDIEEDGDEEGLPLYEEEDLKSKALAALRKILVDEFGMEETEAKAIKTKAALVEKILELQEEDADADEEEDEEEDEDEEDESDEDEDEEDEEEDDDPEHAAREELAGMERTALKVALKKRAVEFRVTTKTTDDEIREALVPSFLEDPPF